MKNLKLPKKKRRADTVYFSRSSPLMQFYFDDKRYQQKANKMAFKIYLKRNG